MSSSRPPQITFFMLLCVVNLEVAVYSKEVHNRGLENLLRLHLALGLILAQDKHRFQGQFFKAFLSGT